MVVIRPSGYLVNLESIRLCSVFALFPHSPPTAQPSHEVSELQLNLRWSGKRKLLFFLTIILDVHSWFDFKGTLQSLSNGVWRKHMGKYTFGDLSQHFVSFLMPSTYLDLEASPMLKLSVVLSSFIFPP